MSAPTTLDRMWAAFRLLVRAELHELGYLGMYTYVVRGSTMGYVDAEPASQTLGLPSVTRAPILPAIGGETAIASTGSECTISFLDGDPTRPVVVSLTEVDELVIADGDDGVARLGDTITLGYCLWDSVTRILYFSPAALGPTATVYVPWGTFPSGTTLSLFAANPASPVAPSPGTPGTAWSGIITTASTVVRCG